MVDSVSVAPMEEYRRRLLVHEERASRWKAMHLWMGYFRLLLIVAFLVTAWFAVFQRDWPRWVIVVPIVLFVAVGVYHGRVLRRLDVARRSAEVYRQGLARMEESRAGGGRFSAAERDMVTGRPAGLVAKLKASLYATDLDIVGRGGLFELLCVARTRAGEETLLEWLLEPAAVSEILERQAAVKELRGRVEFRERIAVAGKSAVVGVQAEALLTWAGAPDRLRKGWMPWVAGLLGVLAVALAVLWLRAELMGAFGTAERLLLAIVGVIAVEAAVRRPFKRQIVAALEGTDQALKNLQLLSALLKVMEAEEFDSVGLAPEEPAREKPAPEKLTEIKRKLSLHSVAGSAAIGKLARLGDLRESMDNMIVKALDTPLMYSVQVAFAVERWRRRHGGAVRLWLEAVAEMEALLSLATYSYEHPDDPFPEFLEGEAGLRGEAGLQGDARLEAVEIGHPLIAAEKCVRNSLRIGGETRVLLISGSNMSGKSTLMRTVGVNTVMAMCGAPVRAESLRLTPVRIGASLLVNDSLQEGHSRFYAEIERLNRICRLATSCAESCADESCADGGSNDADCAGVMFLLDELLQGTNSKDRLAGAQGVIRALVEAGAIGIVTTHDLALAEVEGLKGGMKNMHFQDQIVGDQMRFDFRLREGVAMKSNGVELMRLIGLKV